VWRLVYRWFLASDFDAPTGRSLGAPRVIGPEIEAAGTGRAATAWRSAAARGVVLVTAAVPLSPNRVIVLDRPARALAQLVDRGIGGLIVATAVLMLLVGTLLLGYATWMSLRIRRLARAADVAMSNPERAAEFPVSKAGDEIGALSRSFASLLKELRAHNDYLQTLADKLSHELQTPLAVVRSSLENLRQQEMTQELAQYADRADEGVHRLALILRSMSEASRLERSIEDTDRESFDLVSVLQGCVGGYRSVHGEHRIAWSSAVKSAEIEGAPELIAQMLDKLVDNAMGFSPPDSTVNVELRASNTDAWEIGVSNDGPLLPSELVDRVFESMVSRRAGHGGTHLGMGLYIVRLIARFHGGRARAANRADGSGVEVTITLPA
jgi:signal transduction histidine kinase